MSNLEIFCKALNWQGGTIHQVSEEFIRRGMSPELCQVINLIRMNENAARLMASIAKAKEKTNDSL